MDVAAADHLLTTTRSVRKRLDFSKPVDLAVIRKCIEIAMQAPTGSNAQGWQFVIVTDAAKRKAIADLYKQGFEMYAANPDLRPTYSDDDMVATPVDFSETRWAPGGPSPECGQHTEEVLLELGLDWERIGSLKDSGAIP